jgi:hypothetical protein
MSYKNRKYMYDLLVKQGRYDEIVDQLNVEFGIPERVLPVEVPVVDEPKKKTVKKETN